MTLPIRQTDVYAGLAEISGLMRSEGECLMIEYHVKDEVLGMFNSKIKKVEIPFSFVDQIEIKKRWFFTYFQIYFNRFPSIKKPLVLKENCLSFRIKRKDLEKAKSLKSSLMLAISEKKLKDLDSEYYPERHLDESKAKNPPSEDSSPQKTSGGLNNMLRDD